MVIRFIGDKVQWGTGGMVMDSRNHRTLIRTTHLGHDSI